MKTFKLKGSTRYAIDLKGAAVINSRLNVFRFIEYPEAAIWLVLANGYHNEQATQMLVYILGISREEVIQAMDCHLREWKKLSLIE